MEKFCSVGVYDKKDFMESNFKFGGKDQKYCQIYNNGDIYNIIDKDQHYKQS